MSAPLLSRLLLPHECEEVSRVLEHRYQQHVENDPRAKALSKNAAKARELSRSEQIVDAILAEQDGCELCGGARVDVETFRDEHGPVKVIVPCKLCRRVGHDEFMRLRAERTGIETRDPWDVPEAELIQPSERYSAPTSPYLGDRGAYDPHDDLSDLQPFTRTSKP